MTNSLTSVPQSGVPVRRVVRKKAKVDTSKFMTPYLAHSQKMLDLFSYVSEPITTRSCSLGYIVAKRFEKSR